jgi:predicted nucleotidyltransferase component of viral defense system
MMDIIRKAVQTGATNEEKINQLREFLQILLLRIVFDRGYFKNLSFVGGTALRLLYDLRRFSEDLDFSLINSRHYQFKRFVHDLITSLEQYGLQADITTKDQIAVQRIDVRFKNILQELGLSAIESQKNFVRLEIDSNPPAGWTSQVSLINRVYVFTVTHFDLASMYALKVHACFYRTYIKGRDYYDLIWYLGKKIEPNYDLLNNAIMRTEHTRPNINQDTFKNFLRYKIQNIDFKKIRKDVERFLEDKSELQLFDQELMLTIIT